LAYPPAFEVRRRIYRLKTKWTHDVLARRFKVLEYERPKELEWELDVLDKLEKLCFAKLATLGVPEEDWEYYLGYAKRLFVRALKFTSETYALERESLRNEYILRGWDANVLDQLEPFAVQLALTKKTYEWGIWLEVFIDEMVEV